MRLAEVFLRIGSSLCGWLMAYAHCLWLAVLPQAICGGESGDPWAATLGLALPAVVLAFVIPVGRRTPGIGHILRWLAVPLVLLVPLAVRAVLPALERSTFEGAPLCLQAGDAPVPGWEPFWAPVQLVVLSAITLAAVMAWRLPPTTRKSRIT